MSLERDRIKTKGLSLKQGTENEQRGTGNGNGESLKAGIFKMGNL